MTFKEDCAALEGYITEMQQKARAHTVTEMVQGGLAVSTVCRFIYPPSGRGMAVSADTLRRIAARLDELDGGDCERTLQGMLQAFIRKYILTDDLSALSARGLNYKTLRRMRDYEQGTNYHIKTLITYGRIMQESEEGKMRK